MAGVCMSHSWESGRVGERTPAVGKAVHRVIILGELALPLASSNTPESEPCTPLDSTAQLTLMVRAQVSHPKRDSEGELALTLLYSGMGAGMIFFLSLPFSLWGSRERWPCSLNGCSAWEKVGPAPGLDNTVELALVVKARVSQA